jgi:hypothetical protein
LNYLSGVKTSMARKQIVASIVLLAICLVAPGASAQANFTLKQILKTGDDAPVPNLLSFVRQMSFNNQGQVAFIGDGGLFLKTGGTLTLLAAPGDAAPGGGTFLQISTPSINSAGQVVFAGAATKSGGLFLFSQGTITLLVANGAVSTTGDLVFPTQPVINDSGVVAFVNNGIPGFPLFGQGIFQLAGGAITRIAAIGDPAPGQGTFTGFDPPAMNSSGQVVFHASLQETLPNPFVPTNGLFLASGGSISKIIDSGDTFPDGSTFFDISGSPSINDGGQVAFAGFVDGSVADEGVYLFSAGTLTVVVPGFSAGPNGIIFLEIVDAAINNAGQIAFESLILGSCCGRGVFLSSNNTISQIMVPGQASPDGDTFSSSGAFALAINASGQVLFASRLLQHTDALYVSSGTQLARVAGQGDPVNRDPEFRFPFAFGMSNSDDALADDETFPGGEGLFTAHRSPPDKATLDAHFSQSAGSDGVITAGFFENFPMNGAGQVVMNVDLSSGIAALLLKSGGTLTELVRASFTGNGDPAPGGGTFRGVRQSSINNLGQVLFSGFASHNAGLYLIANGQTTLAIDGNTPLPDGSGRFGDLSSNALNDNGDIAFFAQPFTSPSGMFVLSNNQFTTLARDGGTAPGGGFFSLFFPDPRLGPVISDNGSVAFASDLSIGGRGVFLFSQGVLTRIVGPGDGSPDGSIFFSADAPTINASGQVAFSGQTGKGFGVFLFSGGTISKIAAPGDTLPDHRIFEFTDLPQVNDLGHVAFTGDLSNGTTVIFIARPMDGTADDSEVTTTSGQSDSATPFSLAAARARHPLNFLRKSREDLRH